MTAIDATTLTAPHRNIDPSTRVLLALFAFVAIVVSAAIAVGPVVLTLTALTLVPMMFAFFILISRP